jgi:hypothetical protein
LAQRLIEANTQFARRLFDLATTGEPHHLALPLPRSAGPSRTIGKMNGILPC